MEQEEEKLPHISFTIVEDGTVQITAAPYNCSAKHWGALLYLVQSGSLAAQTVKCMDVLAKENGMDDWVNAALLEWFSLVAQAEKLEVKEKKRRNPVVKPREVLGHFFGNNSGPTE